MLPIYEPIAPLSPFSSSFREMSLAVIESILESTDISEVLRPFQDLDITYLLTVFFSVFLGNVGIETVKSIIGRL